MNQVDSHNDKSYLAARELSAFVAAVTQQYGPELAELSAEDWLQELEQSTSPCGPQTWREVTIAASARLAERLNLAVALGNESFPLDGAQVVRTHTSL